MAIIEEDKRNNCMLVRLGGMLDIKEYLDGWSSWAVNDTHNDFSDGSFSDAIKLSQTGWKAGTTDIMANLENIKVNLEEEPAGYFWDVTGQFFDVGAVLSGEPEHWMETDYEPTRKVVKIVANVAASGGNSAESLRMKGGAILALVDFLQNQGCIVALATVTGLNYLGRKAYTLHDFGMTPLDWDAASFALAHGAYFRRLTWACLEKAMNEPYIGAASCWEPPSMKGDPSIVYIPSGDLRRPDGNYAGRTAQDMAEWVRQWAEKALTLSEDDENREAA